MQSLADPLSPPVAGGKDGNEGGESRRWLSGLHGAGSRVVFGGPRRRRRGYCAWRPAPRTRNSTSAMSKAAACERAVEVAGAGGHNILSFGTISRDCLAPLNSLIISSRNSAAISSSGLDRLSQVQAKHERLQLIHAQKFEAMGRGHFQKINQIRRTALENRLRLGRSRRTSNRRCFEEILFFSIRAEEIGDETHTLVEIRPVLGAGTMFALWDRIEARKQLQDIRVGQRTKVVWKRSREVATQLNCVRRRQPKGHEVLRNELAHLELNVLRQSPGDFLKRRFPKRPHHVDGPGCLAWVLR